MNPSKAILQRLAVFALSILVIGCVPVDRTPRPTLDQVRLGNARGQSIEDTQLAPGEISGEIERIDPARGEISVINDTGRRQVIRYDINRTQVRYHGRDYRIEDLEAGDRVAYRSYPRDTAYVDLIRVLEPVQARTTTPSARSVPPRTRVDVVEGTVERVDTRMGTFEVRPPTGRMITVSVPYNAAAADVDSFRGLRRGDRVRVEGQFVNPDNLQLLSFLATR
jgi:hypothetical protein